MNTLYYGDNLNILRECIKGELSGTRGVGSPHVSKGAFNRQTPSLTPTRRLRVSK